MSNKYDFECLNCGQEIEMETQYAGMEVECPQCEKKFLSPEVIKDNDVINLKCRSCKEIFSTSTNNLNLEIDCPICNKKVKVPTQKEENPSLGFQVTKKTELDELNNELNNTSIVPGCVLILVILGLFIWGCVFACSGEGRSKFDIIPVKATYDEQYKRANELKFDAFFQAKETVRRMLKSPSSASFHGSSRENAKWYSIKGQVNDFECHVTVDAQNSFGAVIRSKYIVTMTYLGSDRWTLKDVKKGY